MFVCVCSETQRAFRIQGSLRDGDETASPRLRLWLKSCRMKDLRVYCSIRRLAVPIAMNRNIAQIGF